MNPFRCLQKPKNRIKNNIINHHTKTQYNALKIVVAVKDLLLLKHIIEIVKIKHDKIINDSTTHNTSL